MILSVLAGRGVVVCPRGFADSAVADAIAALYAPHVAWCSADEHAAFVGNCIALAPGRVWMSARAGDALSAEDRHVRAKSGFVDLGCRQGSSAAGAVHGRRIGRLHPPGKALLMSCHNRTIVHRIAHCDHGMKVIGKQNRRDNLV